eukprot:7787471-Pyramimonas_sp.AAC.1
MGWTWRFWEKSGGLEAMGGSQKRKFLVLGGVRGGVEEWEGLDLLGRVRRGVEGPVGFGKGAEVVRGRIWRGVRKLREEWKDPGSLCQSGEGWRRMGVVG